jgi:hypothetical protein
MLKVMASKATPGKVRLQKGKAAPDKVASFRTIIAHLRKKNETICTYYPHLEKLLTDFPVDIALSYCFAQLELAQNMAIYTGLVKIYNTDYVVTSSIIRKWHITRDDFKEKIEIIYKTKIPDDINKKISYAETIRDNVMHGKEEDDSKKRKAIIDLLDYSEGFSKFILDNGGANVFGTLRGFKGRKAALDKVSTRWILKGIGFFVD